MRRSRESRWCTPITVPTMPACWRSTASSASNRARWSSSWRRRWHRPLRSEIRASAQAAAIIGCGMSVIARPGDSGLATQTDGFAIVVEGLRKRYGSLVAVDGISFRVKEREIFGLLGPNGAGKTTTVEILEGLRGADDGQALVGGINVRKDPQKVKNVIGVQLQSSAFFDGLSLLELLDLFAALYKRTVDAMAILKKVDLTEKARAKVSTLSGGQKQRFSIATALVNEPQILFLDEPTTGLDPQARRNLWELAQAIREDGRTIVLAKGFRRRQVEREANLEDVFLDLTGHDLHEG